ncbi:MAG TPA: PQQ-dependent sugar dehydrogenase [Vicinamibacterales bacterium]|nr:PQQ-dependent sugar dehydrogenase [Vicinamibacterales bacterium]
MTADTAAAAALAAGFSESVIASGLRKPTAMAFAPDGRLFVCEQDGTLRVIKNGVLLSTPFVSLTVNSLGERGLLGVTFDRDFRSNGFVYVYYTATTPTIHNRVSRFTAAGDVAQAGSELVLMDLEPLSATNHNGGAIHFGNDGKLYVAVGENAVPANSQTLANRLGKILRINADGSIPADNPFYNQASGVNRSIWAMGLRNPFTFAIEPLSGTMHINDVGQNTWEEINLGIAGANYGWPATEGPTSDPAYRSPLFAYTHTQLSGCAIAGGAFQSLLSVRFPARYWGAYFFADLCGGWIRARHTDGSISQLASGISQPVDLAFAGDDSLYYLARGGGSTSGVVYRIAHVGTPAVTLTANGSTAAVSISSSAPLNLALAFDAGSEPLSSAGLYVGVIAPFGTYWLDPAAGFVTSFTPLYEGPLPSFGPSPLVQLPSASVLPPGAYWWVVFVDRDGNGAIDVDISAIVLTVITEP